ncbi:MAG: ankyrin repeat domain-containing protein [Flavobacteriales bacterium]|nr:ankyrin repeat domain-containing protein [Flavobacteriales bacterium]
MDRRHFLSTTALGLPLIGSGALFTQDMAKPPKPAQLPAELVKAFVSAGHNNLPEVQRMLKVQPGLLNACWDLGGGDFETALEGAGHVGDREIAEYLIGQGARANIFVLTMLGHTAVVKGLLSLHPHLLRSKGPHGFTLLHHAQRGGEPATELLDHIKGLGLTETKLALP